MTMWTEQNNKLIKEFNFEDFKAALQFVNQVGQLAEAQQHHPDILLYDYKNVRLTLTTHNAGKVTDKDHTLAENIDSITKK